MRHNTAILALLFGSLVALGAAAAEPSGGDLNLSALGDSAKCNAFRPEDQQWSLQRDDFMGVMAKLSETFPGKVNGFVTQACGVVLGDGRRVVLVDAIHVVGGERRCDDAANFAMLYDPKTQTFGPVVVSTNLC